MLANNIADRLIVAAEEAVTVALNELATNIYFESQIEVPKGPMHEDATETLAESGRYPGNDPNLAASPEKLFSSVGYESAYAGAQHEGYALITSKNGKEYVWVVSNYTTEGTKKKFLEDPFKAAAVELEPLAAEEFDKRLAVLSSELSAVVWE